VPCLMRNCHGTPLLKGVARTGQCVEGRRKPRRTTDTIRNRKRNEGWESGENGRAARRRAFEHVEWAGTTDLRVGDPVRTQLRSTGEARGRRERPQLRGDAALRAVRPIVRLLAVEIIRRRKHGSGDPSLRAVVCERFGVRAVKHRHDDLHRNRRRARERGRVSQTSYQHAAEKRAHSVRRMRAA
jgi:hypothetical protein